MLKRLMSVLLSFTVVVVPAFTVTSFAGNGEESESVTVQAETTQNKQNTTEISDTKRETVIPIETSKPVDSVACPIKKVEETPKVEPRQTIKVNLNDLSEKQLQELIAVAKSQEVALAQLLYSKKSNREAKALKNETLWQTCKRKCIATCKATVSGVINGIPPAIMFATYIWYCGQGFKLSLARQLFSTAFCSAISSLFNLAGHQYISMGLHLLSLPLSNKIIPGTN
ncbi:MAG: hypothetical protein RUMPE_00463 [Eubacteriales bacterium SKADARSKE-1]|nr:hypothetical protein [Eubacteriales bacterium SKADARSKE-1]